MSKLTDPAINTAAAALAPGQRAELRDSSGLVLRLARAAGGGATTGSWTLRRTFDGRQRRLSIGPWPGLKIGAAREALSVALGRLAKGEDVFAAAEAEKKLAAGMTVAEAIDAYVADRRSELRSADAIGSHLRAFLKSVAAKKIMIVTQAEIVKLGDKLRERAPQSARLGLAYTRSLWAWAFVREEVAAPLTLKAGKARRRERVLTLDELRAIWAFAEAEPYPFGPIVQTLMLTALRRGEVAGLRVAEVDFKDAILRLPAARMKAKVAFDAALSDPAMAVLQRALEQRPEGSPYVFATVPDAPFSGWSKAKRRADKAVGFADWTLHDFRRGIVTAMAERGLSDVGTLDAMLAHSATASLGSGAAAVYQTSALLASRRKAALAWAELLLDVKPAAVVGEAEGADAAAA